MTRSLLLLSITALLPACQAGDKSGDNIAEGNAAATAVNVGADEQAIRGQVDRWLQLVKAKDAAGIAALYVDDGAVMPPNAPSGKGRAAIHAMFVREFANAGAVPQRGPVVEFVDDGPFGGFECCQRGGATRLHR